MSSTSPPPDNASSRRSSTVPLGHWASEAAKPPRDLDDVSHYAPALIKAIGKMGATELSMAMRSGSGVIADMCALAKVTGGDFAAFLHSRLPELEGDADALLYTSSVSSRMSIEGGEEHQIAPDIVEVFATRGDDGLFGVDIMDSPSHQIYHVVVTILPGSAAERDSTFMLGDVIISVDGKSLGQGARITELLTPDKKSFRFEVLRAGLLMPEELLAAEPPPKPAEKAAPAGLSVETESAAPVPGTDPLSPTGFRLNLGSTRTSIDSAADSKATRTTSIALNARSSTAAPKQGDPTPRFAASAPPRDKPAAFTPETPRSIIFQQAAEMNRRHARLQRARQPNMVPVRPPDAPQPNPHARRTSADATPRQIGENRTESDEGFAT